MNDDKDTKDCGGCGHALALHFRDVNGVARCLWTAYGVSTGGVCGMPYLAQCNCGDFVVPKREPTQRELDMQAHADEVTASLVAAVQSQMAATATRTTETEAADAWLRAEMRDRSAVAGGAKRLMGDEFTSISTDSALSKASSALSQPLSLQSAKAEYDAAVTMAQAKFNAAVDQEFAAVRPRMGETKGD